MEQQQQRRAFYDIHDASYEYRIKRFSLWCGCSSVATLLHKTNKAKYTDLHDYIKSYPDTVETWMEELRDEVLNAYDWDKIDTYTREEKNAIHNQLQNKYQVYIR